MYPRGIDPTECGLQSVGVFRVLVVLFLRHHDTADKYIASRQNHSMSPVSDHPGQTVCGTRSIRQRLLAVLIGYRQVSRSFLPDITERHSNCCSVRECDAIAVERTGAGVMILLADDLD